VPPCASTARPCVLELIHSVLCITFILVTPCSAPHSRHACGGGLNTPKNVNFGVKCQFEKSNLYSYFHGEAPTPMTRKC
jgi:hypothetical protein